MNKLSNFEIIGKLGVGAYSSVYKVKRITDGKIYALKVVKLSDIGEREKQNALNEVRIIASIQHPNIVSYKECFIDSNLTSGNPELCIVMEYAEEGDLLCRIEREIKQQTSILEKDIWSLLIQTVLGLKALHDRKIFHRDLKCANIFLFRDKKVKLGDFNVSKLAKQGLVYTQTGTPYYASPEVWSDKPYDGKADIWSLGCVIYEMCALKPPFRSKDMEGLFKAVMKGQYPTILGSYSQELASVIKSMLQVNPENRPDCDKILNMPSIQTKLQGNHCNLAWTEAEQSQLLKTIKWPSNKKGSNQYKSQLISLNLQLPESNYNQQNLLMQANQNHIKRQSIQSSIRIKSQEIQGSLQKINKTTEAIQTILNQIGSIDQYNSPDSDNNQFKSEITLNKYSQKQVPKYRGQIKYYPNIQQGPINQEGSSIIPASKNEKKPATELSYQQISKTQRYNLSLHQDKNQSQNYSLSGNENSTRNGIEEGVNNDLVRLQYFLRYILASLEQVVNLQSQEILEPQNLSMQSKNFQNSMYNFNSRNSQSKEKISQHQSNKLADPSQNYYVCENLAIINKQKCQPKLPSLHSCNSQNYSQNNNIQQEIIEEEYQLDTNKHSLNYRKNLRNINDILDKKPMMRQIKKLTMKPTNTTLNDRSGRSNDSVQKDTQPYTFNSLERLKRLNSELTPKLPGLGERQI